MRGSGQAPLGEDLEVGRARGFWDMRIMVLQRTCVLLFCLLGVAAVAGEDDSAAAGEGSAEGLLKWAKEHGADTEHVGLRKGGDGMVLVAKQDFAAGPDLKPSTTSPEWEQLAFFNPLYFYRRSPESGDLWYTSGDPTMKICSPYAGW